MILKYYGSSTYIKIIIRNSARKNLHFPGISLISHELSQSFVKRTFHYCKNFAYWAAHLELLSFWSKPINIRDSIHQSSWIHKALIHLPRFSFQAFFASANIWNTLPSMTVKCRLNAASDHSRQPSRLPHKMQATEIGWNTIHTVVALSSKDWCQSIMSFQTWPISYRHLL